MVGLFLDLLELCQEIISFHVLLDFFFETLSKIARKHSQRTNDLLVAGLRRPPKDGGSLGSLLANSEKVLDEYLL